MGMVRQDRGSVRVLGCSMPREQAAASATSVSSPRTCACTPAPRSRGTCGSSRPSILLDAPTRTRCCAASTCTPTADQGAFARRARQGHAAVRACAPAASAAPRRADHRPRSRRAARGPRRAHGRLRDERRAILFSSHNTQDVEQIPDAITFLDRGRIIDSSDKETFLDRWRRLHLDMPQTALLCRLLPGVIETAASGRTAVVTTKAYTPDLNGRLRACRRHACTRFNA